MKKFFLSGWTILGVLMGCFSVQGGTVLLRPEADASLFESMPDFNSGQSTLVAGRIRTVTLGRSRSLIKFNPGAIIPSAAVIQSAALQLHIAHSPAGGAENSTFGLHRLLTSWGEGAQSGGGGGGAAITNEVTWNSRFHQFVPWAAPGASNGVDFVATPSATALITNSFGDVFFASTAESVADVQDWLQTPAQNHGWLLQSQNETTLGTARRFSSREDPVSYPVLQVSYLVPVRIEPVVPAGTNLHLSFVAFSNQTHQVEFCTNLIAPVWLALTNVPAAAINASLSVTDVIGGEQRFYRVVSE